jgi:hypothetical protein
MVQVVGMVQFSWRGTRAIGAARDGSVEGGGGGYGSQQGMV